MAKGSLWGNPGPDGGWSWVVAFACLLVNLYTNGLLRSQGLLYLATLDTYHVSRELASWPFSLCIAAACFSGLSVPVLTLLRLSHRQILFLTGFLVFLGYGLCFFADETGLLWITVCYGVISGVGTGLVTPTLALVINQYFIKERTTANGISLAGTTIGAFVFPSTTNGLLEEYGLRGTFLALGAMTLHVWVAASLIRPRTPKNFPALRASLSLQAKPLLVACPAEAGDVIPDKMSDSDLIGEPVYEPTVDLKPPDDRGTPLLRRLTFQFRNTVGDPMFTVVALSALSSIMVLMIFAMIIVDHAVGIGLPRDKASMLLPAFSLPDLIGRLSTGWLSDKGFVRRKYIFMMSKSLSGVLLILLPVIHSPLILFLVCGTLGLLEGSATILTNILFVDYLGLQRLAMALGLWSFSIGIVFLAIPPLIGVFKDNYGHYDNIFYLMGAISVLSAVMWLVERPIMNRRQSQRT